MAGAQPKPYSFVLAWLFDWHGDCIFVGARLPPFQPGGSIKTEINNVHDIDYLGGQGLWKAEADDITGEDFELHVNPETGMIVHIEDD